MKAFGLFSQLCLINDCITKRSSSWDRTGGNSDWIVIPKKSVHVLLDERGPGCINHFYWTFVHDDRQGPKSLHIRNNVFRGFVLKAYWNGEDIPSIEVPLGDFFGVSNGQFRIIKSLAFVSNPGARGLDDHATWGFNCYLPMPFIEGARLEIENQGEYDGRIWYHIDYELYKNGDVLPSNTGLLHSKWNRENPTQAVNLPDNKNLTGKDNYIILDVEGKGKLAGYFLTVVNKNPDWWGEGDDMVFIDGEEFPSIHGTGSEEIFGGGACPDIEYTGPYTGFHCIENRSGYRWYGTNGMYRFFINDPITFNKSIRVTVEHGHANSLANDYSSVAYWYQVGVNKKLGKLPPIEYRMITDY